MSQNNIGRSLSPQVKRARFVAIRDLTRLAAALDKAGKPEAPISLPVSIFVLSSLGLRPGIEGGTFLFGRHTVKGLW